MHVPTLEVCLHTDNKCSLGRGPRDGGGKRVGWLDFEGDSQHYNKSVNIMAKDTLVIGRAYA